MPGLCMMPVTVNGSFSFVPGSRIMSPTFALRELLRAFVDHHAIGFIRREPATFDQFQPIGAVVIHPIDPKRAGVATVGRLAFLVEQKHIRFKSPRLRNTRPGRREADRSTRHQHPVSDRSAE